MIQAAAAKSAGPPMAWLHMSASMDPDIIAQLCDLISDRQPDMDLLVTYSGTRPSLDLFAQTHELPDFGTASVSAFLDRWKPTVVAWMDGNIHPRVIRALHQRRVPLHLIDVGNLIDAGRSSRIARYIAPPRLKDVSSIVAGDAATVEALLNAGARADRISLKGILEPGHRARPCNEQEWEFFASALATRPIWLAADVNGEEFESVLAAHTHALRRMHRLILLLKPADPDSYQIAVNSLDERGFRYCRRSEDCKPDADTQVLLIDVEDDLGLWFRIAPITFIGRTLAGSTDGMIDPINAAALGSVVLHGLHSGAHGKAFTQLARAGASMPVSHSAELAEALGKLASADTVAQMAHAAWLMSTAGSEILEHVVDLVTGTKSSGEVPQ